MAYSCGGGGEPCIVVGPLVGGLEGGVVLRRGPGLVTNIFKKCFFANCGGFGVDIDLAST